MIPSFVEKDKPLAMSTSWLIGGHAEYFAAPKDLAELQEVHKWAIQQKIPITILGGGSNVLISDEGISGLTIHFKNFNECKSFEDQNRLIIQCFSGTNKSTLLKIFLKAELAPALFLAGLPGDVGGGIVMNAGVAESFQPREFVELVDEVEVLKNDGSIQRYSRNDLNWSYRHSDGWQPGIITKVQLSWPNEKDSTVLEKVRQANKIRLSKQPLDMPSCGSVFRNPEGYKAAQLIDQCGLKGLMMGDAQVSLKHANFIVNTGKATAQDTWNLIQKVKQQVFEKTGVTLQTEVVRLGNWK